MRRRKFIKSIPLVGYSAAAAGIFAQDSAIPPIRAHKRVGLTTGVSPLAESQGFDWDSSTALDLLAHLEVLAKQGRPSFTVNSLHLRWISEAEVHGLITKVNDKGPAAEVVAVSSSRAIHKPSTVGKEAIRLLLGYWTGIFPYEVPGLTLEAESLIKWYSVWSLAK